MNPVDPTLGEPNAQDTEPDMIANSTLRRGDFPSIVLRNSLVCDLSGAVRNLTATEILAGRVVSK